MEDLMLKALECVYFANVNYIGKINEESLLEEDKFARWMSSFLVRRVKREYFSDGMLRINILNDNGKPESNFSFFLEKLEDDNLIVTYGEYIIITELGIAVFLHYKADRAIFSDYNKYFEFGLKFISKGLSQITARKIDKLFPHGLQIKEIVFVVYLLLNGAVTKESAFVLKETTSGFLYDIDPIIHSFKGIYESIFEDDGFEEVIMQEKEFSNFMRRNTGNGTLGRVFNTYFSSSYQKSAMSRIVYFDLPIDVKSYETKLKEVLEILLDSSKNIIERNVFARKLRELTVSFIIENPLLAHQQLLFFNNVDYRDLLYSIISILDNEILE